MIKYVPILRGKDGELAALQNLDGAGLNEICPLLQFLPDNNPKRVGDYLTKVLSKTVDAWNFDENLMYFDVSFLDDITLIANLANGLKDNDVNFIPVIESNSSRSYLKLLQRGFLDNGLCIRIKKVNATPSALISTIDTSKADFNIKSSAIDLLIDLEYIDDIHDIPIYQNTFFRLFDSLKNAEGYRRIIFGSGSFPPDVAMYAVDRITPIPRIEWDLWRSIIQEFKGFPLVYGDYGNVHPRYDPAAQAFPGSCSIKYTSEREYIIFRGIKASGHRDGGGQYHQKSRELIESSYYDGRGFSWGDEYIYRCANREIKSGNAGTWVKYTLNHHFMKILSLLG